MLKNIYYIQIKTVKIKGDNMKKSLIQILPILIFTTFFLNFHSYLAYAQLEEILEDAPPKKKEKQKTQEQLEEQLEEQTTKQKVQDKRDKAPGFEELEDVPPTQAERMKFYREIYEDTYDATFEEVWAVVQKSLEDANCQIAKKSYSQNDEGLYRGSIISEYCVFSTGEDTTFNVLKKYSVKVPVIRGGIWITGRMRYKFTITEKEDGTVHLVLNGEISGFERYVTGQVHFWESNGYFETMMLRRIRNNLIAGKTENN